VYPKNIKTREEYQKLLERFEDIFRAKQGTSASDEADELAPLIKEYEEKYFAIEYPPAD